jgi:serine phosphatase RsbU (regulator of sigma subunit)
MIQVMGMAGEIARREAAIEENRYKLEILNQAILDIFSCSDAYSLTRQAMTLAHKVCGVTMGWFLPRADGLGSGTGHAGAAADASDAGEGSGVEDAGEALPPMLCVEGEVFDTKADEVAAFVSQPASERIFPFTVSSRYRVLGDLTLGFAKAPDPSIAALLRSLMSLANLAMTRQSFIRETAFIAAELQVAETVQRSMLPGESGLHGKARIAYHYEPVLRVGGDWFSVMESRDGDSLYVVLGDVTGHGLAQGLVTTAMAGAIRIVQSMLRHATAPVFEAPSEIVTQLDDVIAHVAGKSNLRMTCVAARLDFREMRLTVCNAGHTFPLLIQPPAEAGGRPRIQSIARNQQLMLGEEPADGREKRYVDAVYPFTVDDHLLFYTDGLTEAQDRDGKAFVRKFHRHLSHLQTVGDATGIKDKLIELFRSHIEGVPAKDDICVLVIGADKARATRAA